MRKSFAAWGVNSTHWMKYCQKQHAILIAQTEPTQHKRSEIALLGVWCWDDMSSCLWSNRKYPITSGLSPRYWRRQGSTHTIPTLRWQLQSGFGPISLWPPSFIAAHLVAVWRCCLLVYYAMFYIHFCWRNHWFSVSRLLATLSFLLPASITHLASQDVSWLHRINPINKNIMQFQ